MRKAKEWINTFPPQTTSGPAIVAILNEAQIEMIQDDATATLLTRLQQVESERDKSEADAAVMRGALHDIFELASRQKSNRECATDEGLIATALAAVRVIRKVCDNHKLRGMGIDRTEVNVTSGAPPLLNPKPQDVM